MALLDPYLWGLAKPPRVAAKAVPTPSHGGDEVPAEPPRSGEKCRRVWEIAEEMHGARPDCRRSEVLAECARQGINRATARTQYQCWYASKGGSKNSL